MPTDDQDFHEAARRLARAFRVGPVPLATLITEAIEEIPGDLLAASIEGDLQARIEAMHDIIGGLRREVRVLDELRDRYLHRGCPRCGTKASTAQWTYFDYLDEDARREENARWTHEDDYEQASTETFRICAACAGRLFRAVAATIAEGAGKDGSFLIPELWPVVDSCKKLAPSPRERTATRDALDTYFAILPPIKGLVKIGKAVIAEERLRSLGLTPILIEPGGSRREQALHARFAHLRIPPEDLPSSIPHDGRTEWFSRERELEHYLDVALN